MFKRLKSILSKKKRYEKNYEVLKRHLLMKYQGVKTIQVKKQLEEIIDEAFDSGVNFCLDEMYKLSLKAIKEADDEDICDEG